MENRFDTPLYKRSRSAYLATCAFEYLISLCVTDAFLAKLLTYLGLSDATCGLISSFISLAFVIQLLSIVLNRTRANAKTIVIVFYPLSQILNFLLYLTPFLPIGGSRIKLLVMTVILVAWFCRYLCSPIYYRWANAFVDPSERASYSAIKEIISLIAGIVFTAVVGRVFDNMEAGGNIEHGFIFIAVTIFVINVIDVFTLNLIGREEKPESAGPGRPLGEVARTMFGNAAFRDVVIMQIIHDVGIYFTTGFLGVFKTNTLMYSVFAIQLINIVANLGRMALSLPFGRFSDRTSFAKGMQLGMFLTAAAFLCCAFTAPSRRWLIIVFTVLYFTSQAGTSANSFNIAYSYVDPDCITEALALKNCISGLCGFGASFIGARLLDMIQSNGNMFLGIHVYGQQVLALISCALIVADIIFVQKRILPRETRRQ